MGWTKLQIVNKAYGELALQGYIFDINPEELDNGLLSLDLMMGAWSANEINLGYTFAETPDESDLAQDTGLPLVALSAVIKGLAIDIAGSKGKQIPRTLAATYKAAFSSMASWMARQQVREVQMPVTLPRGAGNKPWRGMRGGPFMSPPSEAGGVIEGDVIGIGDDDYLGV